MGSFFPGVFKKAKIFSAHFFCVGGVSVICESGCRRVKCMARYIKPVINAARFLIRSLCNDGMTKEVDASTF